PLPRNERETGGSIMNPTTLSAAGLALILAGVVAYAFRISRGDVAKGPVEVHVGLHSRQALTLGSVARAVIGDAPGGRVFPISLTSLAFGAFLMVLHLQRRVPQGTLRVRVGDRLLPFDAHTPEGELFASDALEGRRVLLKFFRGEWCPFCQAELKQFDAMRE